MLRRLLLLLALACAALAAARPPRGVLDLGGKPIAAEALVKRLQDRLDAPNAPVSLTLRNAHVAGPLDLHDYDFPFILRFYHCVFEGDVSFGRVHTDRSILFNACTFRGRADFSDMHVGRDFQAEGCRFEGTQPTAEPRDNDPTTFLRAVAGDDFSLKGSTFLGAVNLRHLDVGRDLYLQDCVFRGGEPDPDGERGTVYKVKLEGSQVGHFLRIDRVLDVQPKVRFAIDDVTFAGIFAQSVAPNTDEGEAARMLRMLNDLKYHDESYDLVQREFERRGLQELADDVYIHGRDRATAEARGFDRLKGIVLRVVAGYGRKPALAFAWCFLAVLLGAVVFAHSSTVPQDRRKYLHAFWYSLDLFVPLVSVSGKEPEPPDEGFARNYVRLHRILGWLLLPIALGSISGIVGR